MPEYPGGYVPKPRLMLYRAVVLSVQIGCPRNEPAERGAPVDEAALCWSR